MTSEIFRHRHHKKRGYIEWKNYFLSIQVMLVTLCYIYYVITLYILSEYRAAGRVLQRANGNENWWQIAIRTRYNNKNNIFYTEIKTVALYLEDFENGVESIIDFMFTSRLSMFVYFIIFFDFWTFSFQRQLTKPLPE